MQTKSFLSLWILMLCSILVEAQQGLNATSHSVQINGMTFDYSIGEMVLVNTESTSQFIITQGLLQPHSLSSAAPNGHPTVYNPLSDAIRVYPNPSDNRVFVDWTASQTSRVTYRLYDATGKVLLTQAFDQHLGSNQISLEIQAFAAGTYYLMLEGLSPDGQQQSFKIQKIK